MLSALFARDFDRYFAEAGSAVPLWLFVHVPKTAGSSVQEEAAAILQPSANIDIDHTDSSRPYQVRFDEAVARFVAGHAVKQERLAAGHVNALQVEAIRRGVPGLRCFTMLRHPIARLISDYRYQCSPMNVARAAFVASTPSFEAYAARRHVHNKMAAQLVPRALFEAGDVEACVDHIMRCFAFVGLQELYPLSLRVLTTLLGQPRAPVARIRVNPETDADRVILQPAQELELRGRNAVDLGIFQVFTARWRDIRLDLREYLRSRQPQKKAVVPPA